MPHDGQDEACRLVTSIPETWELSSCLLHVTFACEHKDDEGEEPALSDSMGTSCPCMSIPSAIVVDTEMLTARLSDKLFEGSLGCA
jgi:hypothetical protein